MGKYCSSTERCSPVTLTSTPGCRRSIITPLSRVSQHLSAHQLTPCIPSRPTGFKSISDSWMTFVIYTLFSYIIRIRESIEFFTRSTHFIEHAFHWALQGKFTCTCDYTTELKRLYLTLIQFFRMQYIYIELFFYLDQTGMPTSLDLVNS